MPTGPAQSPISYATKPPADAGARAVYLAYARFNALLASLGIHPDPGNAGIAELTTGALQHQLVTSERQNVAAGRQTYGPVTIAPVVTVRGNSATVVDCTDESQQHDYVRGQRQSGAGTTASYSTQLQQLDGRWVVTGTSTGRTTASCS